MNKIPPQFFRRNSLSLQITTCLHGAGGYNAPIAEYDSGAAILILRTAPGGKNTSYTMHLSCISAAKELHDNCSEIIEYHMRVELRIVLNHATVHVWVLDVYQGRIQTFLKCLVLENFLSIYHVNFFMHAILSNRYFQIIEGGPDPQHPPLSICLHPDMSIQLHTSTDIHIANPVHWKSDRASPWWKTSSVVSEAGPPPKKPEICRPLAPTPSYVTGEQRERRLLTQAVDGPLNYEHCPWFVRRAMTIKVTPKCRNILNKPID